MSCVFYCHCFGFVFLQLFFSVDDKKLLQDNAPSHCLSLSFIE